MSTEKYTTQHPVCTCDFVLLSKQNCIMAFCLIATCVIFFFFLKYHMPLDRRANDMLMGAECSCQFVVGFLVWNERSVLGDSLGVVAITITLPLPVPPPPPLVNSSRCGTVEWTKSLDRLIHRACQSDVKRAPPLPTLLYAVTTITLPSFLLSTLPSLWAAEVTGHKSLQTWA